MKKINKELTMSKDSRAIASGDNESIANRVAINLSLDLDKYKMDFVKKLTGIDDIQEALEHFSIICLGYHVDPEKVLNSVGPDFIFEGYERE